MHKAPINPYFLDRAARKRDGRVNAYDRLDPSKTALVVVDMQNYFLLDGMPSCIPGGREIVPNINRLAQAVRAAGGLVVWIQTEAPPDKNDWPNRAEATGNQSWSNRQRLLAKDGDGFPIYETCEVLPEDTIAIKTRYSAFIPYPSDLEDALRKNGIDTLLITGVATSTCCESTARDASMWDYRTIMVSDGNADDTDDLHTHTLGKFLINFGDVQSTDQLIEKLSAKIAPSAVAE